MSTIHTFGPGTRSLQSGPIDYKHFWEKSPAIYLYTDITDLVDEDTPYIYTAVNTAANCPSYIIVGGAPDDFGYAEIWNHKGKVGFAARYRDISMMMELTIEEFEQGMWEPSLENMNGTWLSNAIVQLESKLIGGSETSG